ncbi:MAG: 3-oxoacid CoA-transferase [Synergistaceae bacterium]|jgi:propionate CoA-transferase|nr:3-oxoacid CoA-transferase [Synergistaceae bacterium]
MTDKVREMGEVLDLVRDGDVVACSGFGVAALAEEVLVGLEGRFLAVGRPKNLTLYNGSGLSDANGGGSDHLAHEGLLKRIVAGFFGFNYRMRELIERNGVEAYNIPQGVVMRLLRERLLGNPGHITRIGLGTFVDPRAEGGRMNAQTTEEIVELVNLMGEERLFYRVPRIDVGIIRATAADSDGNLCVDEEALPSDIRVVAMAARASGGRVIAQVKHIARAGSLTADKIYLPGIFVDAVVQCREPQKYHRFIGNVVNFDPSLTGRLKVKTPTAPLLPLDAKKIIARRAALEMLPGGVVNLGVGTPEFIAAIAVEEGVTEMTTLTSESGAIGGEPCGGQEFGATRNPVCIFDQPTQFDFYVGGGLDAAFLGFAQADEGGNVNLSRFGGRIYGCGGSIDITQSTRRVIFCGSFTAGELEEEIGDGFLVVKREGRSKKFVREVEQVTYNRKSAPDGQEASIVTERAVFRLTGSGLVLTEIAPGVDLDRDILAQMEFAPEIDRNLRMMDEALFKSGPIGLRKRMAGQC